VLHRRGHVEVHQLEAQVLRLDLGQIEEIVDEVAEAQGVAVDDVDELGGVLGSRARRRGGSRWRC
jgi:hypothetical protein